jgi:hypothetical protein
MIRATALALVASALWAASAPATPPASRAPGPGQPEWSARMRKFQATLQELLPNLASDTRFRAKENARRIERNVDQFARLAHDLDREALGSPDPDPTISIIAGQFANEADYASRILKDGHREYAREILRAMTGYCMACHTRSDSGPRFAGVAEGPAAAALQGVEKGNLLVATRQFDRALEQYERVLADPAVPEHRPFEWERAARSALSIAVRVKKDPDRALAVVDRVLAAKRGPFFLREQAASWKQSLAAWKTEPGAHPATEEGLYSQAVRLLAEARRVQKYPADHAADVLYLRASSAAHDLMSAFPAGARANEGMFMAGLSYQVLRDPTLGNLDELYYQACVRRSPHTEQARVCYRAYEQSVYLGYTGSGGTDLPAAVERRLSELEALAAPAGVAEPKRPM